MPAQFPSGRPSKLNDEQKKELVKEYEDYIRATDDPTIVGFITTNEFCFEHRILDHDIEQWQEFTELKKLAQKKQEAFLLTKAGKNEYNATLAIFRLKQPQHGYKDKSEVDNTHRMVTPIMKLDDTEDDVESSETAYEGAENPGNI